MKEREEEESEWVSVLLLADFYPRKPCGNDHKYLFYAHSSLYRSVHIDRLHCSAWLNERIHIQRNPYSAAKVTFLLALKFSFSLLLCKWYGKKKTRLQGESASLCERHIKTGWNRKNRAQSVWYANERLWAACLLSGECFVYSDFMFACGCEPCEKQHIGEQCQARLDGKLNGVCSRCC